MPISDLDIAALRKLSPAELANLALAADQESRRQRKLGNHDEAERWDAESARLAAVFQDA